MGDWARRITERVLQVQKQAPALPLEEALQRALGKEADGPDLVRDWEDRVRDRAYRLWEETQDPNVPAEEWWQRAANLERANPKRLPINDALLDYLKPSDPEPGGWFAKLFWAGGTNWRLSLEEADRRRIVFALHKASLDDIEHAKHEIAAVDIFVEKAQHFLDLKSRECVRYARICAFFLAIFVAVEFFYVLDVATIPHFLKDLSRRQEDHLNAYLFGMWVLRGGALSGLSGGVIYFLASLVRAFLHEATVLWNRRHSVRLGRLFIYLKFAGIEAADLPQMRTSLTMTDIERAFGWNLETSTAFRDIKPELMGAASPADTAKIIEAAAKLVEAGKPRGP